MRCRHHPSDTDVQPYALGALASRLTYVAATRSSAPQRRLPSSCSQQQQRNSSCPEELTVIMARSARARPETEFNRSLRWCAHTFISPTDSRSSGRQLRQPVEFPDHSATATSRALQLRGAGGGGRGRSRHRRSPCLKSLPRSIAHRDPSARRGQCRARRRRARLALTSTSTGTTARRPTQPQGLPVPSAAMMPKLHVAFADSYEPRVRSARKPGEIGWMRYPRDCQRDRGRSRRAHHRTADYVGENLPRAASGGVCARTTGTCGCPKGSVWTGSLPASRPAHAPSPGIHLRAERGRSGGAARRRRMALVAGECRTRFAASAPDSRRRNGWSRSGASRTASAVHRRARHAANGSAVHQQLLYDDPRVRHGWQAIDDALEAVATRASGAASRSRSVAPLIGGFDLPVALLALHARVTVAGPARGVPCRWKKRSRTGLQRTRWWSASKSIRCRRAPVRYFQYMPRNVLEIPTVNTPRW